MKTFISVFLLISSAHASIWNGDIEVLHDYACLGLDGVPIGNSSPLAGICCSDHQLVSNPPATCKTGFQSIIVDSTDGLHAGITLTNHGLTTSGQMNGNNQDGSVITPNTGGSTSGSNPGEGIASVAGGSSIGGDESGSSAGSANEPGKGTKDSSSGAGSPGSGGSGMGLGSSGGTHGIGGDSNDPNNQKANGGGYVKGSGSATAGGTGGMFGSGMFGGATAGGAGAGVSAGGPNELAFGEGGETAGGAIAGGDGSEDGEGKGSSEDPSDYFNRIDKSANLFKVVSARYMKKKSLWVIPQKLPEELKSKGI